VRSAQSIFEYLGLCIRGAAIGVPTFFVRRDTTNQLLRAILSRTKRTRASRRYFGYLRVQNDDYRRALPQTLLEDGADLIEMFGLRETLADLKARLDDPANHSAAGKLARGILENTGLRSPTQMKAEEFNVGNLLFAASPCSRECE
jgi:hypothetical protein